jgi:hypothetical protein
MRKKTEADLDTFRNEQDGFRETEGFQAEFCKFITEHHLCKFLFYFKKSPVALFNLLCLNQPILRINLELLSRNEIMKENLIG